MRALVVGTGDSGGVGRYERVLLAALERQPALEVRRILKRSHPAYLEPGGDSRSSPNGARALTFASRVVAETLVQRPAVTWFTHPNLARLGPLIPGPYMTCVHGIEVWTRLDGPRRWGLRNADRVVATTSYTADRLTLEQGVERARVTCVPLALEPAWTERQPSPATRKSAGDQLVLLTVSRLAASERYKGVDSVISALPELLRSFPRLRYRVVGTGDDLPRLRALAATAGVEAAVEFTGLADHQRLLDEYAGCDVFVLPSEGEGFGLVYLEAMSFGKPVVALRAGGVPEVVRHGETGILVASQAEVAGAVGELLASPEMRARLGSAGRRLVETEYSMDVYATRVAALLETFSTGKRAVAA
jgi:glycosyltransferase involved in cell wall biosynthesis